VYNILYLGELKMEIDPIVEAFKAILYGIVEGISNGFLFLQLVI